MSYEEIKAKKKTASPLMSNGKTQIHTADIENRILTVSGVDSMVTRNGKCGVITFREFPDNFYFAGKVLTEMCEDFLADEDAMAEIENGKVKIRISRAKSRNGNDYVTFDYVAEE